MINIVGAESRIYKFNSMKRTKKPLYKQQFGAKRSRVLSPYQPRALSQAFLSYNNLRRGGFSRFGKATSELKYFEDTQDVQAITTTGIISYISINRVPAGTGATQRVGRKIVLKSIHMRGAVVLPDGINALSNASTTVRVIMYWDKQANKATATVTGILTSADEKSFNNMENSQRFRILKDYYFEVKAQDTLLIAGPAYVTTVANRVMKPVNIKCNIPVEFSSTTGAIGEITSNNIGILAICSNVNAAHNPLLDVQTRIRFTDA